MTKFFAALITSILFTSSLTFASNLGGFNAPANTGMFGPTAGGNATATMRLAVPADIPALDAAKVTTGVFPLARGGTNGATAVAGFDNLSPLGAKGDTLVYNSTTGHNVKFTACADGDQIQFDSTVAGIGIKCVVPASGSGTVTSVSVAAANGFTGTVATATTTPAITIIASGCNGVCKSNTTTLSTAAASDITGQLLTGFSSGAGVVAATDTILQAFNKIVGNIAGLTFSSIGGTATVAQTTVATQAIGASAIDWSLGSVFTKTLGANTTFTFSNQTSGQTIVVRLTNTASNWTVTWPVGVLWSGGTAPTETVGAKSDIITLVYDGSNTYGSSVQNF